MQKQATTQGQAAPVVAGDAPVAPTFITVPGADGKPLTLHVPTTPAEMAQLRARREQLSDQLENVSDRRGGIVQALRVAPDAAVPGLTAQLKVLDARIVQLETDLATTGQQVSAASPELTAVAEDRSAQYAGPRFNDGVGAGVAGSVAVMSVLLFVLRRRWRRRGPVQTNQLPDDSAQRLMRLEHGMDAIAVEVERISEGQRFVTKLLSESHAVAPAQRLGDPATISSRAPKQ